MTTGLKTRQAAVEAQLMLAPTGGLRWGLSFGRRCAVP